MDINVNYKRLARNYTLMTDSYEYKMASGYLKSKKEDDIAVFDVFFRKIPNGGGYAIMAGLDKVISFIQNLKFEESDLWYFRRYGYDDEFINYLKNFKFTGDIYAISDGTPVFPNEALITVKAPIIEAQIIETALLSIINGAMEHATGARRIVEASRGAGVMEFGSRRADGPEAALDASMYAIMAGCVGTSNVSAANMLGMEALGTMAHSWIESFNSEYDAFLSYAKIYPDNCILLVDTIDTLRSGVPNAIRVFNYMKEHKLNTDNIGIRIDSGDLSYLSKEAYKMLVQAGFGNAKIVLSNGLNAETIESLIVQGAKFDMLGVGDNISKPEGRMGCVYKLVAITENNKLIPKIKLSNDRIKIVNPDFKKLYRIYDKKSGYALADVMCRWSEKIDREELVIVSLNDPTKRALVSDFELVELQKPIFVNGQLVYDDLNILQKQRYCDEQMKLLYDEIKRSKMPHQYYVDGTESYVEFRNNMIEETRCKVRKIVSK